MNSFGKVLDTGAFLLGSEAVFTAPAGELIVNGNFTISAGAAFNANSGTVNFQALPAATKTIACSAANFNKVVFTNTAKEVVGGDCTLPLGSNPTIGGSGGEIVLNGTFIGAGTLTSVGKLTMGATGAFSGFSTVALNGTLSGTGTLVVAPSLTLNATGTLSGFSGLEAGGLTVNGAYNFGAYAPFDVNGSFAVGASGSFTAPAGIASISRNFTIDPASTFNANSGTISFDGSTPFTMACGNKTLSLVTFSAGHKTIGSNCTVPLGENPNLGTGGTTLKGTLTGSGELTQSGTFEIESSSPGLALFTDVKDIGALLLNSGTAFTAPEGELIVQGNFLVESGATFSANGGTVNFQGLGKATKTITCNEVTFNLVKLTNTTKQVVNSDCALPLGPSPIIGEGGPIVVNGTLEGHRDAEDEHPGVHPGRRRRTVRLHRPGNRRPDRQRHLRLRRIRHIRRRRGLHPGCRRQLHRPGRRHRLVRGRLHQRRRIQSQRRHGRTGRRRPAAQREHHLQQPHQDRRINRHPDLRSGRHPDHRRRIDPERRRRRRTPEPGFVGPGRRRG